MTKPKSPSTKSGARETRLTQALKDNLRRRKEQARKRASTGAPYPEEKSEPPASKAPKSA
jgi:hypothetical protein